MSVVESLEETKPADHTGSVVLGIQTDDPSAAMHSATVLICNTLLHRVGLETLK